MAEIRCAIVGNGTPLDVRFQSVDVLGSDFLQEDFMFAGPGLSISELPETILGPTRRQLEPQSFASDFRRLPSTRKAHFA